VPPAAARTLRPDDSTRNARRIATPHGSETVRALTRRAGAVPSSRRLAGRVTRLSQTRAGRRTASGSQGRAPEMAGRPFTYLMGFRGPVPGLFFWAPGSKGPGDPLRRRACPQGPDAVACSSVCGAPETTLRAGTQLSIPAFNPHPHNGTCCSPRRRRSNWRRRRSSRTGCSDSWARDERRLSSGCKPPADTSRSTPPRTTREYLPRCMSPLGVPTRRGGPAGCHPARPRCPRRRRLPEHSCRPGLARRGPRYRHRRMGRHRPYRRPRLAWPARRGPPFATRIQKRLPLPRGAASQARSGAPSVHHSAGRSGPQPREGPRKAGVAASQCSW
jgi:hypothetical protein